MTSRQILKLVTGQPATDGAGVRLTRVIGTAALPDLDPVLMLDEFGSDDPGAYIAGFPSHPHRGFETLTYMLAGRMRHRDNRGNEGLLGPGSVQWMTAGRGIVHSEMPEQEEGLMRGFQLWLNLPAADKMCDPHYADITPDAVPVVAIDGGSVKVIAGTFGDATGPVSPRGTAPLILDVALDAGTGTSIAVPAGHAAFAYPFDGDVQIAGTRVPNRTAAILGDGDRIDLSASGAARVLIVAARPLREPVARYGPFVMNTQAELRQAFADYQANRF